MFLMLPLGMAFTQKCEFIKYDQMFIVEITESFIDRNVDRDTYHNNYYFND